MPRKPQPPESRGNKYLAWHLLLDAPTSLRSDRIMPLVRTLHHFILASCATAILCATPMPVAAEAGKRFFPIERTQGVATVRPSGMHSDTVAMRQGFMRIDRELLVVNRRVRAPQVVVTRPEPLVAATAPQAGAVNQLFGSADTVAGAQFARTIRGGQAASLPRGKHAWPIPAIAQQKLTSGYGMRRDPFHGKPRFHGGIDIAAAVGTPVLASADGVVKDVGTMGNFGKGIAIQHADGSTSMYGHLSAQNVRKGQRVLQGQKIGAVGSTGRSTGPHLDYRLKKNGQGVNPMAVLVQNPSIRLADARRSR